MVRSSQATSHTFSTSPYFDDRGPHGYAEPITERVNPHSRPIVSYYFPKGVGAQHYGARITEHHPMKPHRLTLTNALVLGYGLDKQIHNIYNPRPATQAELEAYHEHDYIEFLSRVTPHNQAEMRQMIDRFNCVEDCPIFADMFDFCKMYCGASLAAARKLCAGTTDIAINWSGGLHHAKKSEASGFCYVNDIVLAILELLRYHPRVLYIDIDIHHGDGVEFAFYHTNRVMTVSFHKYTGEFFPGTGKLDDNGTGPGKHFCLNVPLKDGIDDDMYLTIFKTVIDDTVTAFRPTAIVLQCGADSLGCDRLGAFNLSIAAHGECVNFVRKFNVPLLVLGGGGYTIKNVSRCWTYETSVLVGAAIPDQLPVTIYDSFFRESKWKLHPPLTGHVENQNTPSSLQRITVAIRNKLRYLQGAPSVALQEIPPDLGGWLADEERTREEKDEERGTAHAGETREDRA
ncbi:histone deacetylase, partial [Daedaleopsis nitida]